uniref:Uncharacterized protein n=1 Tax=Kalanchoe fedtschenkoi TaxID=63787 RepID=A0A7N0U6G8_KALFE
MRRSFSGGNHRLPGSTEICRTVARAATRPTTTTSVHEPFSSSNSPSPISSSKPVKYASSSSGSTTPRSLPVSAVSNPIMNYYRPSFPSPPSSVGDEFEWLAEDGGASASASDDDLLFGPAPSVDEVQAAVSSLQHVIDPASFSLLVQYGYTSSADNGASDHSSNVSEVDWMEPSLQMYHRVMPTPGSGRVFDAFRLLHSDAAVQRMVVSLASDRAVWNAVLNNDVVKELRGSLNPGQRRQFNFLIVYDMDRISIFFFKVI